MKAPKVIGIVLLFGIGSVTPAAADWFSNACFSTAPNWFSNPYLGISRNIGSAPNPTPDQLRQGGFGVHPVVSNVCAVNSEYVPKPVPPWPAPQWPYHQAYSTSLYYQPYAQSAYGQRWALQSGYATAPYRGGAF